MFQSARLKLTAWYVCIIALVCFLFSLAFYRSSTWEIDRFITRVKVQHELEAAQRPGQLVIFRHPGQPTIDDLQTLKHDSIVALIFLNGLVVTISGVMSYFLAGRTLRPIKKMVDDQQQFIENASHELRTPLATMRAEMEGSLLEKRLTASRAKAIIASALEELDSLQTLTNNLLLLTKVRAPQNGSFVSTLEISDIINAAHKKVKPFAKKKNIQLELQLQKATVRGVKSNLVELFTILLDNAVKYSADKTTVRVVVGKKSGAVVAEVSDEGKGIASQDLPHIFERFYRADKSRSEVDGYGLGLSIAQKIVEVHDGTITVRSRVGKGTVFIVTLPFS